MNVLIIRFLVGGFVVSLFAALGDVFGPKSFAGTIRSRPFDRAGNDSPDHSTTGKDLCRHRSSFDDLGSVCLPGLRSTR